MVGMIVGNGFIGNAVGLVILMSVNITLGSVNAIFTQCFNWRRCRKGIGKSLIILLCFVLTYFAGWLNQDIVAVNVGGIEANVVTALSIIVVAGYCHYAVQVIGKLVELLGVGYKGKAEPKKEGSRYVTGFMNSKYE